MSVTIAESGKEPAAIEQRIEALLGQMTLAEKIGQMTQLDASSGDPAAYLGERLRSGRLPVAR